MSLRVPCVLLTLALLGAACADHGSGLESIAIAPDPSNPSNPSNPTPQEPSTPSNPTNPGNTEPEPPSVRQPSTANPQPGEPIPEPGTMLLLGTGLAGAAMYHRRRQRRKSADGS